MESKQHINQIAGAPPLIHRLTEFLNRWATLETVLIGWFLLTPIASFYFRIPTDKSLITFDRAIFTLVVLILVLKSSRPIRATKFEIVWLLFSVLLFTSAITQANNTGFALRIAVDAFVLPLIAFHAARSHIKLSGYQQFLFLATVALALFLLVTGFYEYRTGVNLFAYKGSELLRDNEIRVNGPFLSDSSYAIICLLVTLFLRLLPRWLKLTFDRSARLLYVVALAASAAATLISLFRAVALTLFFCWALLEILFLLKSRGPSRFSLPGGARRIAVYAIVVVFLVLAFTAWQELSGGISFARRLTSPRNVYGRLATWQTAARIALENPLFGVGLTNYTDYFDQKFADWREQRDALADTRAANTPHSNLLWVFAEFGALGLALYLLAFLYLARLGYRAFKRASTTEQSIAGAGVLILLIAYTIPGLTLQSGAYWDLNLYFFFMLGLLSNKVTGYRLQGTGMG